MCLGDVRTAGGWGESRDMTWHEREKSRYQGSLGFFLHYAGWCTTYGVCILLCIFTPMWGMVSWADFHAYYDVVSSTVMVSERACCDSLVLPPCKIANGFQRFVFVFSVFMYLSLSESIWCASSWQRLLYGPIGGKIEEMQNWNLVWALQAAPAGAKGSWSTYHIPISLGSIGVARDSPESHQSATPHGCASLCTLSLSMSCREKGYCKGHCIETPYTKIKETR